MIGIFAIEEEEEEEVEEVLFHLLVNLKLKMLLCGRRRLRVWFNIEERGEKNVVFLKKNFILSLFITHYEKTTSSPLLTQEQVQWAAHYVSLQSQGHHLTPEQAPLLNATLQLLHLLNTIKVLFVCISCLSPSSSTSSLTSSEGRSEG
jgi:hypothetical protein